MMRDCWIEKAEDRPNFSALVQRLENVIASNMAAMVSTVQVTIGSFDVTQHMIISTKRLLSAIISILAPSVHRVQ